MTVAEFFNRFRDVLAPVCADRSFFELRLLVAHYFDCRVEDLIAHENRLLSRVDLDEIHNLIQRRLHMEPFAYVVGKKEFYGLMFEVNQSVLIPRPETEGLVEEVLQWINRKSLKGGRIIDLGTGSGCIALSLGKNLSSDWKLIGIDYSMKALEQAQLNAKNLHLSEVQFLHMDLFEGPNNLGDMDIIVSNPPYIPTQDWQLLEPGIKSFEPRESLDGGSDGLKYYRAILEKWWGKSVKLLALETYNEEQRGSIIDLLPPNQGFRHWSAGPHLFVERG